MLRLASVEKTTLPIMKKGYFCAMFGKNLYFVLMLVSMIVLSSCDNDIELVAPYRNIPVTYGLLDKNDTAQYIRVEKAYLDPAVSALILAQEPDSLYYPQLDVVLENLTSGDEYSLTRVDGNLEGYPRASGVFAESPNWMYKIKSSAMRMRSGDRFRIKIDRGEPYEEITGTTTLIGDLILVRPRPGSSLDFSGQGDQSIVWQGDAASRFFDVVLYIYVSEWDPSTSDPKRVIEIPWELARSLTDPRLNFSKKEIYSLLANRLEEDPSLVRSLDSFKLEIKAGGEELYRFIQVSLANTGITASQEIPRVTNLSEGYGVFSSKASLTESDFDITRATFDSLKTNPLTAPLNFR